MISKFIINLRVFIYILFNGDWNFFLIFDRPRIWFYYIYYDGHIYSLHLGFFAIAVDYLPQYRERQDD